MDYNRFREGKFLKGPNPRGVRKIPNPGGAPEAPKELETLPQEKINPWVLRGGVFEKNLYTQQP